MNLLVWIAVGTIVMTGMFVALIISFYHFLIGPEGKGPQQSTDPAAVQAQIISISGAPGLILAGIVFGMSKTEERAGGEALRSASMILIADGIIMIAGMVTAATMVSKIDKLFILAASINVVPYIFIIAGIGMSGIGLYLFRYSRNIQPSYNRRSYLTTNWKISLSQLLLSKLT